RGRPAGCGERNATNGRRLPAVPRALGGAACAHRLAHGARRTERHPSASPVRLRHRRGAPAHPRTARLTDRGRTGKPVPVRVLTTRRTACHRVRDGRGSCAGDVTNAAAAPSHFATRTWECKLLTAVFRRARLMPIIHDNEPLHRRRRNAPTCLVLCPHHM